MPGLEAAPPRDRAALALALLLGCVVLGVEAQGWVFDAPYWGDRDLARAARLFVDLPTTGAELSYGSGARLPGGFQSVLLALPWALTGSPLGVWRFQVLLTGLGALALALGVRRAAGDRAGAAAGLVWLTTPAVLDVGTRLWNPGQAGPFLAAACGAGVAALGTGRRAPLLLAGLLVGLAGQLHATAWLLGALGALLVAALGPTQLRRAVPLAVAAAAATLLPHLVDEALHGWPNTRAMLDQIYVRDPASVVAATRATERLAVVAHGLGGSWAWATAAGALASWGIARACGSDRAVARAGALAVLALAAWIGADRQIDLFGVGGSRYVAPLAPPFAVLVALGLARVAERHAAGRAVGAIVLCALAGRAVPHGQRPSTELTAWSQLRATIDDVQAATGWSLEEVAGRTAWPNGTPGATRMHAERGIDALLLREGARFPGSLPPPCALVVDHRQLDALGGGDALDADALDALLPRHGPEGLAVLDVHPRPRGAVVIYTIDGGHCPTVFSNRYLATDLELAAWSQLRGRPHGTVEPLEGFPHTWAIAWDVPSRLDGPADTRLALALRVQPTPTGLDVELHANQLRGLAYNEGFWRTMLLEHPRLVLTGPPGEVVVPLALRFLGDQAELTPVRRTVVLPPGPWTVALEGALVVGLTNPDVPVDDLLRRRLHTQLLTPVVVH